MSEVYLEEWVLKAEEDCEVATVLLRKRKRPTPNAVCFHCQQCCEKYLKAFLVKYNVIFPKTHDLLELHKLCLSVDSTFALISGLLNQLNPYSVEFRYPGEIATLEEAKAAAKAMKKVRHFVRSKLNKL
jgi:HEPN domain-containing protein